MGLANLEARSAAIGGSMTIETAPGEGTRVEVRLPVR
jgi:signal transduction histidine kinase